MMVMDLVPPRDTFLGLLEIDEVYLDYEGPRLFCAISPGGRRYLALHIAEDETTETYVYMPVSDNRFRVVRSGGMSFRAAFQDPEDECVYVVTADYVSGSNSVAPVKGSELADDQLPSAPDT